LDSEASSRAAASNGFSRRNLHRIMKIICA
jgi:hypothetical protein